MPIIKEEALINRLIVMKKSIYYFLKGICYLEISTLSIIAVLVTIDTVIARPICYFVDANGRRVNLSFVCPKPPNANKSPVQSQQDSPQPQNNQTSNTTTSAPEENNSPKTNNSETNQQEKENIDQSYSSEKIPLFNN